MPPSQLKRLKTSLREQGIVGPQLSKKQKKQNSKNGATKDKRVQRNAALQGIREQFNPFEVKAPARGNKFDVTNSKTIGGRVTKGVKGRPGVTKGLGEEAVCSAYCYMLRGVLIGYPTEAEDPFGRDAQTEQNWWY